MTTIFLLAGLTLTVCQYKSKITDWNQATVVQAAIAQKVTAEQRDSIVYESENLIIRKLSDHTFQHISYLNTEDFGKVDCNGMIVINEQEAVVFDTPADAQSSLELIQYLKETMNCTIKGIFITHFHADCVAGLAQFHQNHVRSYSSIRTMELLKNSGGGVAVPQNGFSGTLEIKAGDHPVSGGFFGEGHTKDNIVGYYPEENVLFGGCLIKEMNAGKGNLADANEAAWAETVKEIREEYPNTEIVIPGHGKPGGSELLDYTIQLFDF